MKYKIIIFGGIVIICLALFGPILIKCCCHVEKWEAGDILNYYGSALAFLGAGSSGILSLYQNKVIRENAEEHEKILLNLQRKKEMPRFSIKGSGYNGDFQKYRTILRNVSENWANDIIVTEVLITDNFGEKLWEQKTPQKLGSLDSNQTALIELGNSGCQNAAKIKIEVKCKDVFDDIHKYNAVYEISDLKKENSMVAIQ